MAKLSIITFFAIFSVRGFLGSSVLFSYNLGMLLEFVLGAYFDYYTAPKIVIGITIVCVISLCYFPETPSFLLKQGKVSVNEIFFPHETKIMVNALLN